MDNPGTHQGNITQQPATYNKDEIPSQVTPSGSRELKKHPINNISPETAAETAKDDLDTWAEGTDATFATPIEWA
ncbi:hypothetical protein DL766_006774 [Monosporascus sp. MC13-8B]|uniref:Uncharacterized protein n=1 Tax=Monosporascus cannonballus TaxID=155416 RepID=A0ABY0HHP5_9PEZI|nr:hypothetical protein DL763_008765 [Monosporascus cannonballus]RYO91698.1 hypothetical protein DL762_002027 [Monosporascus cannonballus]RYP26281.1 hypothetical protein DL766_006774 [Monosporascus sp. MC13-8B]